MILYSTYWLLFLLPQLVLELMAGSSRCGSENHKSRYWRLEIPSEGRPSGCTVRCFGKGLPLCPPGNQDPWRGKGPTRERIIRTIVGEWKKVRVRMSWNTGFDKRLHKLQLLKISDLSLLGLLYFLFPKL